jgi:nitrate/nitrite transporter NarK
MVSCIAYGFLFHIGKHLKWVVVAMLGLTAIGSFLVNAAMSANSSMMYVSLVVLGLGMGGLYTAALYLLNAFVDQQNRGYITGLQTWSGTLGICIVTVIGAVLIDNTTRSGAFNLFGALSLLFIPITFILYRNASSVTPQTPSP